MRNLLTTITLASLVLCFGSAEAQYTGKVSIDSVEAAAGEKVVLNINLSQNNAGISLVSIPIKFDEDNMTLDSVSFVGTLIPTDFIGQTYYDNSTGSTIISILPPLTVPTPYPAITATSGVLARVYMTVSGQANPGNYPVDSVYVDSVFSYLGVEMHLIRQVEFADNTGDNILLPMFDPGVVYLQDPTGVNDDNDGITLPAEFALEQNYPNPFNPMTIIAFALPKSGPVSLDLFNVLGQKVSTLVEGDFPAGQHEIEFDASGYPSGIYFYRLRNDSDRLTKKMTLLK